MAKRTYGGVTGARRMEERRAHLLSAGLELLSADDAPRRFTVRGVCRASGLAARYFYENFEDIDELAVAVYDEEIIALTSATLGALECIAADDTAARTRAGLGTLIGHIAEDPRRGRLLYSPTLAALPAIAERRRASTRLFVGLLVDEASTGSSTDAPPDVVSEVLVGGLAQAISAWLDGDLELEQDDFVDACTKLFVIVLDQSLSQT